MVVTPCAKNEIPNTLCVCVGARTGKPGEITHVFVWVRAHANAHVCICALLMLVDSSR